MGFQGDRGAIQGVYRGRSKRSLVQLYTVPEVAHIFLVSPYTVKRWVRDGYLKPRYHALSGRAYRIVFEESELLRFFEFNFPSPEDLSPHAKTPKARLVEKIQRMKRLFGRKGRAVIEARRACRGDDFESEGGLAEPEDR
jgi:hypothetical protein